MNQPAHQPTPRLATLHAIVFGLGVLLSVGGLVAHIPQLLLIAGPCLVIAGCLVAVGIRITLGGPVGHMLRAALGRTRVATRYLRAVAWILAGILVTAWGMERIRAGEHRGPPILQDPAMGELPTRAPTRSDT